MSTLVSLVKIVGWVLLFGLPILFLFAGSDAMLAIDPLTELYTAAAQLFGEMPARLLFCILWLVADIALFWRFVIQKKRAVDAADLHD